MGFGVGGLTKPMCDLLDMGMVRLLLDTQAFDLDAVSNVINPAHHRITAGAYIGQEKPLEVHNKSAFLQPAYYETKGLELGTGASSYTLVSDAQGNVKADLKVNSFKPYIGIGFGRAVPKKTIGMQFDLGVQFWGTPEIWANINDEWGDSKYQKVDKDKITNPDKDYQDGKDAIKNIEKVIVYPVLTFRLIGRIL